MTATETHTLAHLSQIVLRQVHAVSGSLAVGDVAAAILAAMDVVNAAVGLQTLLLRAEWPAPPVTDVPERTANPGERPPF